MKLLPAFSGLFLALQFVGVVSLDNLQQPRFVKLKRSISEHGTHAERLQSHLHRRGDVDALLKVQEAIKHFEGLAGTSKDASHGEALAKLKDLELQMRQGGEQTAETHFQRANSFPVHEHYHPAPPAGFGIGQHYGLTPTIDSSLKERLDLHEQALAAQRQAIEDGHDKIAGNTGNIDKLYHDNQNIRAWQAAKKKADRWRNFAIGAGSTAIVLGSVTSAMSANSAAKGFSGQREQIDELKAEVERLKAGQRVPATNGPTYYPTSGQQAGAGGGGLV